MGVKRAGGKRKLVPKEPAEATTEDGADTDGRRSRNVTVETKTTQKITENFKNFSAHETDVVVGISTGLTLRQRVRKDVEARMNGAQRK